MPSTGATDTTVVVLDFNGDDALVNEVTERELAQQYVVPEDVVLELGARFGGVSVATNRILKDRSAHVVVEPDARVWTTLRENRERNDCGFHIVEGLISNRKMTMLLEGGLGFGTRAQVGGDNTPSYTLDEVRKMSGVMAPFTAVLADCEGCLHQFLQENPTVYDDARIMIIEQDCGHICDYGAIFQTLSSKGFVKVVDGFHSVWRKYYTRVSLTIEHKV
jgi:FkbM family methyltransferase